MRLRLLRSICTLSLFVAALSINPASAGAQWSNVASNLFTSVGSGSMCFSDGYLWLAGIQLYASTDSGLTWSQRTFPDRGSGGVAYDIQFFDRLHGIMACGSGTFLTTDGGFVWKNILPGNFYSCCFGLSSSIIATASASANGISVTTDGGITWITRRVGDYPLNIHSTRDNKFVVFAGSLGARGKIYTSTNFGQSWDSLPGRADFDSYSFAIDSCDNDRIYLVNEDVASPTDDSSQIFLTTNHGLSWSITDAHKLPFYTGAIGIGYEAIYAPTVSKGIMRSSDKGMTWKSVGGPSNDFDTRFISAITDNLVVAADAHGNVWRTITGGGDSIFVHLGKLTIDPTSVTLADTLAPCQPAEQIVITTAAGCGAATVKGFNIEGKDSLDFLSTSGTRTDSIIILFQSTHAGVSNAQVTMHLSDGSTRIVPLTGFGTGTPQMSVHTLDISNDTIGGSIYVPIIADQLSQAGDLGFNVSYDTSMLDYVGSFTPSSPADGTVRVANGRATVSLPNVLNTSKDRVIGYSLFHIFPSNDSCTIVTIDSVAIRSKVAICAQSGQNLQSKICSSLGCSTRLLSALTRFRNIPHLVAHPNPNAGTFSIESSVALGPCSIDFVDCLGVTRASCKRTIERKLPVSLEIAQLPQGAYSVVVHSIVGVESVHILLIK